MCDHCGDIWDRVDDAYDRLKDQRIEALFNQGETNGDS